MKKKIETPNHFLYPSLEEKTRGNTVCGVEEICIFWYISLVRYLLVLGVSMIAHHEVQSKIRSTWLLVIVSGLYYY